MEANRLDEQVSFRISSAMLRRLTTLAKAEKRKRADMVRILFVKGWQAQEREKAEVGSK